MDGQQQRRALTAAERSIKLAFAGDPEGARRAAATAETLDQLGLYEGLPDLIVAVGTPPDHDRIEALTNALGPGPLAALVEELSAAEE